MGKGTQPIVFGTMGWSDTEVAERWFRHFPPPEVRMAKLTGGRLLGRFLSASRDGWRTREQKIELIDALATPNKLEEFLQDDSWL